MENAFIFALERDGNEYNSLFLLRSLELIDPLFPIYCGIFTNRPPTFDLIRELEVSSNLIYDRCYDNTNLKTFTCNYFKRILKNKFKNIIYLDKNTYLVDKWTYCGKSFDLGYVTYFSKNHNNSYYNFCIKHYNNLKEINNKLYNYTIKTVNEKIQYKLKR